MSGADAGELPLAARTVRKVAIRLVPFLMLLFFVNYLDRTTLGIAKTDISEHLQLSATMFGLVSGIFFIGYVLVEIPPTLPWIVSARAAGWRASRCRGGSWPWLSASRRTLRRYWACGSFLVWPRPDCSRE